MIFVLVDISTIACFLIICVKKAKFLKEIAEKWNCICQKAGIMLMMSLEQEKHLLIQIQLFQSKAVFVPNVSATFEMD